MKDLTLEPLTGAYLRDALPVYLRHFMRESRETGQPFSLVMIDLDHFKRLNDAFGHARGDQVLKHFVERTATAIREEDLLFRYGGDEFLLMLPATGRREAVTIAERILGRVRGTPFSGDPPLSMTLSMGVASHPDDGDDEQELFSRADARLYISKRRGRGRITSGDVEPPSSLSLDEDTRLLERDEALARAGLFLQSLEAPALLSVTGKPEVGHSRFLRELRKLAALQGLVTLELVGTPALARRHLGALAHARLDDEAAAEPNRVGLRQAVLTRLEAGRRGLFVTVEGAPHLDPGTRRLLAELIEAPSVVGVAQTLPEGASPLFPSLVQQTVALDPLTPPAVEAWLQSQLQGAIPAEAVRWIADATGGLPSRMKRALLALVDKGLIKAGNDGWEFGATDGLDLDRLIERRSAPCVLPSWETPLVGRHAELQKLTDRLREDRLTTLTGPGGVGKSRLASQAAHESLDSFPDGVFFVPLAELSRPQAIPAAILDSMGVRAGNASDVFEALATHLEGRRALLLLDTFEHLLEGAHLIDVLLTRLADLHVLITSREPLRLGRERIVSLGGLTRPDDAVDPAGLGEGGLEHYDAVELFATGAAQAGAPIAFDAHTLDAVLTICRLTDGLPLALELAASWTPVLSPARIADELSRNLDLLQDAPGQNGRLRRMLDYFWALLSESEQGVLGALAVMPGGFGQVTAREVAGASLFFLLALRDRHLVSLDRGRYRMHELLRQHALQATAPDRIARWRAELTRYYAGLTERLHEPNDPDPDDLFDRLDDEFANLTEAWRLAIADGDGATVIPLAHLLRRYLDVRGRSEEGVRLFGDAEARLVGHGERREALGWTLEALALFHYHRQQIEEAEASARRALDALHGVPAGRARTHGTLGMITAAKGDLPGAKSHFGVALDLYRQAGDDRSAARTLGNLATTADMLGESAEALDLYRHCLELHRSDGNRSSLAVTLINYGSGLLSAEDLDGANAAFEEALALCEELDFQLPTCIALKSLAAVNERRGDQAGAVARLERALEIADAIGHPAQRVGVRLALARCRDGLGQAIFARKHLEEAVALAGEHGLSGMLPSEAKEPVPPARRAPISPGLTP